MTDRQKISIDVISDVMCPWCYIGKTHLDAAIGEAGDLDVMVQWRPYQLDSSLPKEGIDRTTYLNNKFGGEDRAREIYGRIREAGGALGIEFDFDAINVSPNTMDAHRLILWAGGQGPEIQNKVVERLFEVFFLEGGHIGEDEVLKSIAEEAGMDPEIIDGLLKGEEDKTRVAAEIDHARQMGITGVPCFIIDNKYAVMGAQGPQAIVEAMRHAISEREGNKESRNLSK